MINLYEWGLFLIAYKPLKSFQSSDSRNPPSLKPDKVNPNLDTISVQLLNVKVKEKILNDIKEGKVEHIIRNDK